jgi:hypothetical protein
MPIQISVIYHCKHLVIRTTIHTFAKFRCPCPRPVSVSMSTPGIHVQVLVHDLFHIHVHVFDRVFLPVSMFVIMFIFGNFNYEILFFLFIAKIIYMHVVFCFTPFYKTLDFTSSRKKNHGQPSFRDDFTIVFSIN